MTVEIFLDKFWRYYLILEERFENATRYVELNTDNYAVYSIEFVNQIQTISSEIDVIMKSMSGFSANDRKNITDYATVLLTNYPDIVNLEVKIRDITYKPFEGWNQANAADSLSWWSAYNDVKHGRDGNFKEANLQNVLHALMGLYLLEMLYFKKLSDKENVPDILNKPSELFSVVGWQGWTNLIGKVNGTTLELNL